MTTLIKNIGQLLTMQDEDLGIIESRKGAFIFIKDGKIQDFGKGLGDYRAEKIIDACGGVVMPGFVDAHTHLVFSGTREDELELRLSGVSYLEIHKRGGGILKTVEKTRKAKFSELVRETKKRISEIISFGTTTIEVKSGYGLSLKDEIKILKVIKALQKDSKITLLPTLLAAHAIPKEMKKEEYINLIVKKIIPEVAKRRLAIFCDIFCEKGIFNKKDALKILLAGKRHNLIPKIHADEISSSGGAEVAAEVGAISADHLIFPSENGLKMMKESLTVAVLLPGTALFLKQKNKPPIEKIKKLKLSFALASDFNPGSCPIYQMPLITALGSFLYDLTEKEALYAATLGGAKALGMENKIGSIETGKDADILVLHSQSYRSIFYEFGENPVRIVMKKGKVLHQSL